MSYTLIEQVNPEHAHLTFGGTFQGSPVTWDAHFLTVNEYNKTIAAGKDHGNGGKNQLIDIGDTTPLGRKIIVTLQVKNIDTPTINKAIIMIKQYKNLHPGQHQHTAVT